MKRIDQTDISADEWDELNFPRAEENDFDKVVEASISRRGFLSGVIVFGSGAVALNSGVSQSFAFATQSQSRFAFMPIAAQTDYSVHVPDNYDWHVLIRWGDSLYSEAADYSIVDGGEFQNSDKIFGENTDGMESFLFEGRQLIAVNHEYANQKINLPAKQKGVSQSLDDVRMLQNIQGVTVMEIREDNQRWSIVQDSIFNRRITNNTPMRIAGPAAGHDLMKTAADPDGMLVQGTINNCGSGKTPWGTYLTCEENFNGYFGASRDHEYAAHVTAGYHRYGVGKKSRYQYEEFDPRFDTALNPNEPHRFGWIVEIDPTDPHSVPVKHTGLGRMKHENAEVVLAKDGRVVVYMGDDERGEYLYKFLSNGRYKAGVSTEGLLDDGTLYVAKFSDDMRGQWLPLTPESTGMIDAEIAVFTRLAASKVGATTMDRPEWVASNPVRVEAYCCLTNNKNRGIKPNAGGDDTTVNPVNPRESNHYGQIVRWRPENEDHAADFFEWDLYVMAGNPTVHNDSYAGSKNINTGNLFNSPDGMRVDSTGMIWIQTDGNDSNEGDFAGMGNNQMLIGDPYTGEIARFMTGPKGGEVTGLCWSADRRTAFVGIQHPGGSWPDGEGVPRSSLIAIKREDTSIIG